MQEISVSLDFSLLFYAYYLECDFYVDALLWDMIDVPQTVKYILCEQQKNNNKF